MHQNSFELFKILVKAGATPGEDFSCSEEDGDCRLSERGYQLLKQTYPEIAWDDITRVVTQDDKQAVEALHNHLGVDFTHRLLEQMRHRIANLPDAKAAWYLRQILGGVEQKTSISLHHRLSETLDLSRLLRVELLLRRQEEDLEPGGEWIADLVLSAGGDASDFELQQNEALLTERGLRLLATVWSGNHDLFAELAKGNQDQD